MMVCKRTVAIGLGLSLWMMLQARADWPCYHGAQRVNRSLETNLLERWPQAGPNLIWSAAGLGHGYSSVAISGDRLVTAGTIWPARRSGAGPTDRPGRRPRDNAGP